MKNESWIQRKVFGLITIIKIMQASLTKSGDHSLGPDFATGWKLNLTAGKLQQFPIYFTNPISDNLSKSLTAFGRQQKFRVVYMGPRHNSNLKAYKTYARGFNEETDCNPESDMYGEPFSKYRFNFLTEKEKIFPIRPLQYRLFTGMNPTMKKQDLRFDANFECGNLDLAISVSSIEYDLLMRVDSNTKGHTSWFYFKVTNFTHKQKIKLNIINFQKSGLLYKEGMKPYCYRSSQKIWQQDGENVQYKPKKFRYPNNSDQEETPIIMNCLSFTYEFDKSDEYVYFSYCVPYSYSFLMHRVAQIHKDNPHYVQVDCSNLSTGGLNIPILTIGNSLGQNGKPTCLIIGRLHPGQTQGSWVMDGFLSYLCSPKGYFLRERANFKIIPMINVDGVVLGNFRTGIYGRDLNRVFNAPQKYSQINMIRNLANTINPMVFLDFHGHSAKKNVFVYGPDYGIDHRFYLTTRIFPKLVSKVTSAFRYYGCIFRINHNKINTGRAIMLRQHGVTYAFTIESSSHAYGNKGEQVIFNREEYTWVGDSIAEGLSKYFKMPFILPRRTEGRKEGSPQNREGEKSAQKLRRNDKKNQLNFSSNLLSLDRYKNELSAEDSKMLMQLMNEEKQRKNNPSPNDEQGEDSDFQEGNDYSQKQLKKMFKTERNSSIEKAEEIQIKKIKKKKKNTSPKKETISSNLLAEKSSTLQKQDVSLNYIQRSKSRKNKLFEDSPQKSLSPIRIKKNKSIQIQAPITIQVSEQQTGSDLNKMNYNNWKKINKRNTQQQEYRFSKANSVNHINLDISSEKIVIYEENEALKRKNKERQKSIKKNFMKEKEIERSISQNKPKSSNQIFYLKQSLLPLLSRSKQGVRQASTSLLEQILENHERSQKDYLRKNLKIVHF